MTNQQRDVLRQVANAVVESVKEGGTMGVPGGYLYAALMAYGFSLENFESLMAGLVSCKMFRKSGDLYFYVPRG